MFILKCYFHIIAIIKIIIYKLLFGNKICFGKGVTFRKRFSVFISPKGRIIIGENCFFNNDCSITSLCKISIGHDCVFGEGVKIYDHNHGHDISSNIPFGKQEYNCSPVKIGNNCWIGSNAVILKGVEIGDNVVVGAGCVVYKNIEAGKTVVCDATTTK